MSFFPSCPSVLFLSYLGDCKVLNAQTCNDPKQRWGNNLGRAGGSPPASQLAELFWVSCHREKLWRTKVLFQKQQTNKNRKSLKREPKNYRNTNFKTYFWGRKYRALGRFWNCCFWTRTYKNLDLFLFRLVGRDVVKEMQKMFFGKVAISFSQTNPFS